MKRLRYLLWATLLCPTPSPALAQLPALYRPVAATTRLTIRASTTAKARAKAAKANAATAATDCARATAIVLSKQDLAKANTTRRNTARISTTRENAATTAAECAAAVVVSRRTTSAGSSEPAPSRLDSATSYRPGATLRVELGVNSYGPLTYGNKNLILPFTLDFVQRFTTENRQRPTSGLRLRAVVDPTRHRMSDSAYAAYTLLQTGRLEADADLFVESSPVADFSLNAHGGAGLRFYPLFTQQREWHFYETYEQVLLRLGGGFTYRLRTQRGTRRPWGLLAGNIDYVRHWHDFASRSEAYYRQHVSSPLFFHSLQAQLRFTVYISPRNGLELSTNWYGRPANGPQIKYFDARLGFVYHFGAKTFGAVGDPMVTKLRKAKKVEAEATRQQAKAN